MTEISWPALSVLMAVVSAVGSGVGAYVGMKVGLARLETWQKIADNDIKDIQSDIGVLNDDSLAHDMEIAALYDDRGWNRVVRQRMRR